MKRLVRQFACIVDDKKFEKINQRGQFNWIDRRQEYIQEQWKRLQMMHYYEEV